MISRAFLHSRMKSRSARGINMRLRVTCPSVGKREYDCSKPSDILDVFDAISWFEESREPAKYLEPNRGSPELSVIHEGHMNLSLWVVKFNFFGLLLFAPVPKKFLGVVHFSVVNKWLHARPLSFSESRDILEEFIQLAPVQAGVWADSKQALRRG